MSGLAYTHPCSNEILSTEKQQNGSNEPMNMLDEKGRVNERGLKRLKFNSVLLKNIGHSLLISALPADISNWSSDLVNLQGINSGDQRKRRDI